MHLELILFILMCYGVTLILTSSKLFEDIRPRYHFFTCPMCVGFWVGLFVALTFLGITALLKLILWSALSSGTSYILCSLFDDNGIKVDLNK